MSTTQKRLPFRIGEDDVVGVRRSLIPVDLGGTQPDQAFDLSRLIAGVQVEVDAWRHLHRRANPVEGEVRPDAVSRTQQDEILAVALTTNVIECGLPELGLARQIVDAQDD